jgi:predicted DNA-binding protein (UPF0251 family)
MSRETPRWTRVSNPVTPTVVTFPGGDSANVKPFTRVSNPVTPTVVSFHPDTKDTLAVERHSESDIAELEGQSDSASVWRGFVRRLMNAAVTKLEQDEFEAYDQIVNCGRTSAEAAVALGVPRMALWDRYQAALAKVRRELWNDQYLRGLIASVLNEPSSSAASVVLVAPSRQSIDFVLNELSSRT